MNGKPKRIHQCPHCQARCFEDEAEITVDRMILPDGRWVRVTHCHFCKTVTRRVDRHDGTPPSEESFSLRDVKP